MPMANVNGVQLFYELSGTGDIPLALVHGSWVSHHTWDGVVPKMAQSFRVLTYDRRGHSDSQRPEGQGSIREDVGDLEALLEHLELGPAWIAGNSSGASIALRLAGERPDLCRGLIAHEPPLLSLLADDPIFAPMLGEVNTRFGAVVERVTSGDAAGAAEQFVDTVAVGPGTWAKFSADQRQIFIENAPTFVDEAHDAEAFAFDLTWLEGFSHPTLFTTGTHSPPMFAGVLAKLTDTLPNAKLITLPDAGHIPQETHPDAYAEAVTAFIHKHLT